VTLADIKTRADHCEKHGEFTARNWVRNVWSKCPTCTAEIEAAETAKRDARERAEKLAAWQARIGSAGIPERFQDRSLNNFTATTDDQRNALASAKEYAAGFAGNAGVTGQSLIFVGKPGTGKTHLAVGIGMHLLRQGRPVLFTTVQRAIRRVRDTWSRESAETESQAVAALVYPDLLILDEVGVQSGSEFEKNQLFDILNERYETRRPTLLLSNMDVEGVRAYLGDRIFDRLREDGGRAIAFDWSSHRGLVNSQKSAVGVA
jgi:DNA replication protein DnaC